MAECTAIVVWTDKDPVLMAVYAYQFRKMADSISLEKLLKDAFLDGFDFEDYSEKYGDCFITIHEEVEHG